MRDRDEAAETEQAQGLSRRGAIRAGAAVAVGATVWAEPTIKGLANRPAYAAGSSTSALDFDLAGPVTVPATGNVRIDPVPASGTIRYIVRTVGPNLLRFVLRGDVPAGAVLAGSVTINVGGLDLVPSPTMITGTTFDIAADTSLAITISNLSVTCA